MRHELDERRWHWRCADDADDDNDVSYDDDDDDDHADDDDDDGFATGPDHPPDPANDPPINSQSLGAGTSSRRRCGSRKKKLN